MGGFCPGGFVQGDFVLWGILSRGILSGGFCPGGFVRGDFVLEPLKREFKTKIKKKQQGLFCIIHHTKQKSEKEVRPLTEVSFKKI